MGLRETDQVDILAPSQEGIENGIELYIFDGGDIEDESERYHLLTRKLTAYATFIASDEFARQYPNTKPADILIRVVCFTPPNDAMQQVTSLYHRDDPSQQIRIIYQDTDSYSRLVQSASAKDRDQQLSSTQTEKLTRDGPRTAAAVYLQTYGDNASLIIPANTILPTVRQVVFSRANYPTTVYIQLLYGMSNKVSQCTSIGSWAISGAPLLERDGRNMAVQVHIGIAGDVKIYSRVGQDSPLTVTPRTQVKKVPVEGSNWTDVSLQGMLENAKQSLAEFARQHCGPSRQKVSGIGRKFPGLDSGRREKKYWEISIEEMYLFSSTGWEGNVESVVLDLLQIPESIICVTPINPKEYLVRIMIERVAPDVGRIGLKPVISETVPADPFVLRRLLSSFLEQGILVKKKNQLRYGGKAAGDL